MPHSKTSCLKSYSLAVKPIVVNYLRGHRIGDTGLPVQIGSRFKEIYFPGTLCFCFYTATIPRSWILPPGPVKAGGKPESLIPAAFHEDCFLKRQRCGKGLQLGALHFHS